MTNIEGAVIACAGFGSRLGLGLPKCMIEVDNKTILTRLIESIQPLIPNIYIVVGFRADLIINHCCAHHPDVKIIKNHDFANTNTAHSMLLGAKHLSNKVLFLDGDLIIEPSALKNFVKASHQKPILIGVTQAKSKEPVFVKTSNPSIIEELKVYSFQREPKTNLEWANIFIGSPSILENNKDYVYKNFQTLLPADAYEINLCEIDTPEDLSNATNWLSENIPSTKKPLLEL